MEFDLLWWEWYMDYDDLDDGWPARKTKSGS
jgi:hypothetical protein